MEKCVPVGHPAGTHTTAVSGAVGLFCVAKYSPDVADDGAPREPRLGYSEPAKKQHTEAPYGHNMYA